MNRFKKLIAIFICTFTVLVSFVGAAPLGISGSGVTEEVSGIYITIHHPSGWHTKDAKIDISYNDTKDRGITKIEIRQGEKGNWTDVSNDPHTIISDNTTVYVRVHDRHGDTTGKSRYIECFDREKPTVNASLNGRMLRIEAHDTISGVAAIYVNGYKYNNLVNETIDIPLSDHDDDRDKIMIQAVDHAGNLSPMYSTQNPLTKARQSSSSYANSNNNTNGNNSDQSGQTTQASAPTSAKGTTTEENPPGAGSTMDDSTEKKDGEPQLLPDKQFVTITTKNSKIFYMIIDNTKTDNNVYLLTEVGEADLLNFVEEDGKNGSINGSEIGEDTDSLIDGGSLPKEVSLDVEEGTDSVLGTNSTKNENSANNSENGDVAGEKTKNNPLLGWIVLGIILFGAVFAGYMFLIKLPKKRAKEAFEDDESDDGDDEGENYNDYVDEDDEITETSDSELTLSPSDSSEYSEETAEADEAEEYGHEDDEDDVEDSEDLDDFV